MAEERGQIREGRLKRQGPSLLQQSQSGQAGTEGSTARGRPTPRLLLRKDEWHEEKTDKREDGQRPELTYQQKPTGVELLT